MMKTNLLVLALCGSFATAAHADGTGIYVNGGTTGFGLGLATGSNSLTGRLSYDTWSRTFTQSDSNGTDAARFRRRQCSSSASSVASSAGRSRRPWRNR